MVKYGNCQEEMRELCAKLSQNVPYRVHREAKGSEDLSAPPVEPWDTGGHSPDVWELEG
jgi:phage-related protein